MSKSVQQLVISSIEEIIDDARNGKMFILVDHEDRENEGDLIIPAEMATAETVNFMAKYGRGLICLALTGDRVDHLNLPLMSSHNSSRHETAFTISIEARMRSSLSRAGDTSWLRPLRRCHREPPSGGVS